MADILTEASMYEKLTTVLDYLRAARDYVLRVGPDAIDGVADAMHAVEEAARKAADLLRDVGPSLSFATGPGGDSTPDVTVPVAELAALRGEVEAVHATPDYPRTSESTPVAAARAIDPEMKALLAKVLGVLIDAVLRKVQR